MALASVDNFKNLETEKKASDRKGSENVNIVYR
jgi:hypothetical protein